MSKQVIICNVPYEIVDVLDHYDSSYGQIDYKNCKINISKDYKTKELYTNTLLHEIAHGVLNGCGYKELSEDEQLVQSLANAFQQCFEVKFVEQKK